MFVQALGQGCAFITAILLARHLDINEYGYYIFGVTVATILAVIATMGAGGILARTWGKSNLFDYQRDKETFLVQNWYFKRGISIIFATLLLIFFYSYFRGSVNYIEIFALFFAIPFFVANILQSFFVAKRIVVLANLLQLGLRVIMLFITVFFIVWYLNSTITLVASMAAIMLIYITLIWLSQLKKYSFKSSKPSGSNLSFALMQWGLLLLSQIDILILKGISDTKSIALFGVALQLSALVSFVLNAVNSNVLSQIADDYKNCSLIEFQKRVTSYTKIIFFLSIFAIAGLLVCGYPITLLYGEQYTVSYYIFSILMVGQIINILSGCVATILNMAGYEKKTCIAFYIALLINIVLGIIFTEIWGVYGLAVASSLSMTYWNIHLLYQVVTKLKINPTIFIKI
ncbi:capsular polysaccharide synthesis enzyme Cps [Francisella sp. W12-1067]|nr:capsular polysaccharide synthesis enzyme Cps [Francisella sp. W12-1067]